MGAALLEAREKLLRAVPAEEFSDSAELWSHVGIHAQPLGCLLGRAALNRLFFSCPVDYGTRHIDQDERQKGPRFVCGLGTWQAWFKG